MAKQKILLRVLAAAVYRDRLILPGDQVNLLPIGQRISRGDWQGGERSAENHFNSMRRWLGHGPFTILSIGIWPCDQITLFLKGGRVDGAGCDIGEFL